MNAQPFVVGPDGSFIVGPDDIDVSRHLFDAFDHYQTEISAAWLVDFAQHRQQGWKPFSYGDINEFYSHKHKNGFTFNRLIEPEMVQPSLARAFAGYREPPIPVGGGWIVKDGAGLFHFTAEFILRCHASSKAMASVAI